MPWGLKRFQQTRHIHFLTFSCYHRQPKFTNASACVTFVDALERVRRNHEPCVYEYVIMAEPVHELGKSKCRCLCKVIQRRRADYAIVKSAEIYMIISFEPSKDGKTIL